MNARMMIGALLLAAGCEGHSVDDLGSTLAVTVRASTVSGGGQADAASSLEDPTTFFSRRALSGDGRYVAFQSDATNLVAGDANGFTDVFVFDRLTGTTVLASLDPAGLPFAGPSTCPAISADGRYVVFQTDVGFPVRIYRRDLQTGTTVLASQNTADGLPGDDCFGPAISGDGRYIVFHSQAFDLVSPAPGNISYDVYRRDMTVPASAGGNELVNTDSSGNETVGNSALGSISADGRYVAYQTFADIDATDFGNGDVYVRDMQAPGATGTVFVSGPSNGDSLYPSISADGNWVVFESNASDLVPGDSNGDWDVFIRARTGGPIRRVSVHGSGAQGQGGAFGSGARQATVSGDGRFVAFQADYVNLVDDDTNQATDVFVHDTVTGNTVRVGVRTFGGQSGLGQRSSFPSISDDGRFVAFDSEASNLVDGDSNGLADVFLRGPLR